MIAWLIVLAVLLAIASGNEAAIGFNEDDAWHWCVGGVCMAAAITVLVLAVRLG